MDFEFARFLSDALAAYSPEFLERAMLVDAPFVFRGVWRAIKGWLDQVVAGKVFS